MSVPFAIHPLPFDPNLEPIPEDESPYLTVARVHVSPQPAGTDARSAAIDDSMMFSPWHGLAAHRPLGGVMRSCNPAYEMSSEFRGRFNGCPVHG